MIQFQFSFYLFSPKPMVCRFKKDNSKWKELEFKKWAVLIVNEYSSLKRWGASWLVCSCQKTSRPSLGSQRRHVMYHNRCPSLGTVTANDKHFCVLFYLLSTAALHLVLEVGWRSSRRPSPVRESSLPGHREGVVMPDGSLHSLLFTQ